MPTSRDGDIRTNAPWSLKSKSKSVPRSGMNAAPGNTTAGPTKNPSGSMDRPHVDMINRNKSEATTQSPTVGRTERKRQSSPRGSSDMFGSKSPKVSGSKNQGTANKEEPMARINSGKTSVRNYPAGRNRGRNFKG